VNSVTDAFETIASVLALVAVAGAVALLAARVLAPRSPRLAAIGASVTAFRTPLTIAVAGIAMLGSLYFSEVADYTPCRLCWFQRIAMYPIALVGVVALVRKDDGARWYMVPMAVIGVLISSYHLLIEWDVIADSGSCSVFAPCDVVWFRSFGFMSLAAMALAGFVAIIVINTVSFEGIAPRPEEPTESPREDP
jgi:disulfide bond formation protein DsbB